MKERIALQLIAHAARWASNNLVELGGNHGTRLSEPVRESLRDATRALYRLGDACRVALRDLEGAE